MKNYLYVIPYLLIFLILFITSFPVSATVGKYRLYIKSNQIFIVLLMVFFLGFRGFLATDFVIYYQFYQKIPPISAGIDSFIEFLKNSPALFKSYERGFLLFTSISKMFSASYFFFQILSTSIDIVILYYFFKAYTPSNIVLAFIFFFLFAGQSIEINLMRNSKSIMLFLISIKYIDQRCFTRYLLLNIAGCFFHTSSLIYFPVYFLCQKRYSRKSIFAIYVICNIIFLFSINWIQHFFKLLDSMINTNLGRLSMVINAYTSSGSGYASRMGITFGYIERMLSFILIFCFSERLIKKSNKNIILINCAYIYWFIWLLFSEFYVFVQRFPLLFIFSYWVLYPQIYELLSKKNKCIFLFLLLIYGTIVLARNNTSMAKYENILFNYSSYEERKVFANQALQKFHESRRE
jgi:hypothetical protein